MQLLWRDLDPSGRTQLSQCRMSRRSLVRWKRRRAQPAGNSSSHAMGACTVQRMVCTLSVARL